MPFKKGQSGNLKGRPKGRRDNRRQIMREMLHSVAPDLVNKAVELALSGDTTALKLLLDKILPTLKSEIPASSLAVEGTTPADTARNITHYMAQGRLTPEQAAAMMSTLTQMLKVVEVSDLAERLTKLEEHYAHSAQHPH